jgi:hypothetical protein
VTLALPPSVLHANPQWPAMSLPALDKGFMKLILISMTFLKNNIFVFLGSKGTSLLLLLFLSYKKSIKVGSRQNITFKFNKILYERINFLWKETMILFLKSLRKFLFYLFLDKYG